MPCDENEAGTYCSMTKGCEERLAINATESMPTRGAPICNSVAADVHLVQAVLVVVGVTVTVLVSVRVRATPPG